MVACSPALRILVRNERWRKGYPSRSRSRSKTDNKSNGGLNTIGGTQRDGGGTGAAGERRSRGNVLDAWSRLDGDDMRISPEPKSVISIRGGSRAGGGSGSGSKITTASSSVSKVDETAGIGMRDLEGGPKDKTSFYDDMRDKGDQGREEGRNSEVLLAREQDIVKIV